MAGVVALTNCPLSETAMTPPYKLRVKVGHSEFEAEGPEDAVREQFRLFLDAMNAAPPPLPDSPRLPAASPPSDDRFAPTPPPVPLALGPAAGPPPTGGIDADLLSRAFANHAKNGVSLRVLPSTQERAGDALLMLLYGFRTLKQQDDVSALILMDAAKQSGLQLERVDRTLARISQYVLRGGHHRGTRYGLTNPGVLRAETLLREMLEQRPA
jgi:hypothetical protein